MNFERGQDPKKAINIGLTDNPLPGRKFLVRFKLRESTPEFYPLQKLEEEKKPIVATCLRLDNIMFPTKYSSTFIKNVVCQLPSLNTPLRAIWNEEEKYWEIK